jgi:uncharacterized membrane-anchored protein
MRLLHKGLILAGIQCLMLLSLTGKLLYDRATCPRVWVKTAPYDPSLPIRGRYLALQLVPESGSPYSAALSHDRVLFFVPEKSQAFEAQRWKPGAPELWVEVTIPHKGPPRPIQLGLKKDGKIEPLEVN